MEEVEKKLSEEEKCDRLDLAFATKRSEWSEKVKELIAQLNDVTRLAETQATMLSYRHIFNDEIAKYRATQAKRKAGNLKQWQLRHNYYKSPTSGHQIKLQERELADHIKADLAYRARENDILANQIAFFEEMVQTMDKMGYAIKIAVEIETKLKFH